MNVRVSRRSLLMGMTAERKALRPFGARQGQEFLRLCTKCDACIAACPERIIAPDPQGYPVLNLAGGGCTFCSACIDVCEPKALSANTEWSWKAEFDGKCLAVNQTYCRTCQDFCDQSAIRFRPVAGGKSEPQLDAAACTGCGNCVGACPVGAISLHEPTPSEEARTC